MANEKPRIGFVGLGIMGGAMARNLSKAGFALTVYNRTRAKANEFAQETGAKVAATFKELLRRTITKIN